MPKVIILEGPDGSGKTTLAQELQAKGYRYLHHGLYSDNREQLFRRYAECILKAHRSRSNWVIDRCFWSEYAYGPVMRSEDRLEGMGRRLLWRLCNALGVTTVLCLPPFETVLENWRRKKNDYTSSADRLCHIYDRYRASSMPGSDCVYDYARGGKFLPVRPCLPEGCLGSPTAKVLIVGEQPNKRLAKHDLPFFALNGSSLYLNTALRAAGIVEKDLAITNAVPLSASVTTSGWRAASKIRDIGAVVRALPNFEKAIAVGIVAARECKKQGIPHVAVPHPSYWKRFHHGEFEVYVGMIREAYESSVKRYIHCVETASLRSDAAR